MRAALITLILLLGCGDDGREPTDAGERSCELALCAPYTCDQQLGRCLTECASELDCVEAHACSGGFCVGTECTEATAAERCGGYACVQGTCSPDCASASCAAGYYCRGDTHECVLTCTTREDPSCAGYLCDVETGECESYCFDGELPCATGYTCDVDKQCRSAADRARAAERVLERVTSAADGIRRWRPRSPGSPRSSRCGSARSGS